jgi:hypothetical protein
MPKRPTDMNQRAKLIIEIAIGEIEEEKKIKNPVFVESGRKGGTLGGKKRAEKLTTEQKTDIGKKGAKKRWED